MDKFLSLLANLGFLGGLGGIAYALFVIFTGGWGLIPGLLIGAGALTAGMFYGAKKSINNPENDTAHKAKGAGKWMMVLGSFLSIGAIAAAPFTGGLSLLALYGTVGLMGAGLLTYAGGSAAEADKDGKTPGAGKALGQFFTGLLKGSAIIGLIGVIALAALSVPATFGGSVAFLAPVISALSPVLLSVANFLGLGAAATTAATVTAAATVAPAVATMAGYAAAGVVTLGGIGYMAHKGMTKGKSVSDQAEASTELTEEQTKVKQANEESPLLGEQSYQQMNRQGLGTRKGTVQISQEEYRRFQQWQAAEGSVEVNADEFKRYQQATQHGHEAVEEDYEEYSQEQELPNSSNSPQRSSGSTSQNR